MSSQGGEPWLLDQILNPGAAARQAAATKAKGGDQNLPRELNTRPWGLQGGFLE